MGLNRMGRDRYRDEIGYAFKDLNNDGIPEMMILSSGYVVLGIYTLENGIPVLLDAYWERHRCEIDKDGILYTYGSSGASDHSWELFVIMPNSTKLELIEAVGEESLETEPYMRNYQIIDDVKTIYQFGGI